MREISEFDIFFLSYDEPNAEKNYADLQQKAPWTKRVHGVKGFEAAHRRCAELSETPWFVTVDADCILMSEFLDLRVDLDPENRPLESITWNGVNQINGLRYGNGGAKLWSREFVLNGMVGHEASDDPKHAVDFCWQENYRTERRVMTEVYNNASPYQAFRVGFREGVKLTLNGGSRVDARDMKNLPHMNLRNISVWSSVGKDIPNGIWAIYGARLGWRRMLNPDFDHVNVRDYDWFEELWDMVEDTTDVEGACETLGVEIERLTGIAIPLLDDRASAFFREMFALGNE